jgi:uncharacterized RDD family membrane protein YckC
VGAWLIDVLIVGIPTAVVFFALIAGAVGISDSDEDVAVGAAIGAILLSGLVFVALGTLYFALTMKREGQHNGQTWGKQAVGIRVVRTSGEPIDFGWATLRDPVVQFLGFYFIASNFTFGRALHDMICNTRVINA